MLPHTIARFGSSRIEYGQCWEDADTLLAGLEIQPGDVCVSIASAGDNVLTMLARDPSRVIAVDVSPAQLACLHLRVAAYEMLEHPQLLELMGSSPVEPASRLKLYRICRPRLPADARGFWDERPHLLVRGLGEGGRFEGYCRFFRRFLLPCVHPRTRVTRLFAHSSPQTRREFYQRIWNTWRWRMLIRTLFSRLIMQRAGHPRSFFEHFQGSPASRLLAQLDRALTEQDPAENSYLQWMLTGRHFTALPYALRPENFARIRAGLSRLECRQGSVQETLSRLGPRSVHRLNLSNILEYLPAEPAQQLLSQAAQAGIPGGRLLYWDMLSPRSAPGQLPGLRRRIDLMELLHPLTKTFFYAALVIEEFAS